MVSVDTKKKELVGSFENRGLRWQPAGQPEAVNVHDFPIPGRGKAIPYGTYDVMRDEAVVNVGTVSYTHLYERLNELLEGEKFDEFVEGRCAKFYAAKYGRPSLTPGMYFRSLLLGFFEGISSERGIAWQMADSLGLRRFVGVGLDEDTPDHTTISRTRRLIDVETHREVFGWVLGVLADRGLVKGKRIAIDATTLEANAAMRSMVRRDTGESYEEFLRGLAKRCV